MVSNGDEGEKKKRIEVSYFISYFHDSLKIKMIFFFISIRSVTDYIELSLENMVQLLFDVKYALKVEGYNERVCGLFASNCTPTASENDLFRIDQF